MLLKDGKATLRSLQIDPWKTDLRPYILPILRRNYMGCGVATNSEGVQEFVVAGGTGGGNPDDSITVDVLNLDTLEWKSSENALPTAMNAMASVPFGQTFLLVGGYDRDASRAMSVLHIFNPDDEQFYQLLTPRLRQARQYPTAMFVDVDAFPNC